MAYFEDQWNTAFNSPQAAQAETRHHLHWGKESMKDHRAIRIARDVRTPNLAPENDFMPQPDPASDAHMRINVPAGWNKSKEHEPAPGAVIGWLQLDEFRPAGLQGDAKLCHWNKGFMGRALAPQEAAALKTELQKPPHAVPPADWLRIEPVVQNGMYDAPPGKDGVEDNLHVSSLKTRDLNGRRVLEMEGEYPGAGQKIYAVFGADPSGRFVEQAYFVGDNKSFDQLKAQAKQSIESLKWSDSAALPLGRHPRLERQELKEALRHRLNPFHPRPGE